MKGKLIQFLPLQVPVDTSQFGFVGSVQTEAVLSMVQAKMWKGDSVQI